MALTADEYRNHLKLGGIRAGIDMPGLVLPERRAATLNSLRFSFLDWGGEYLPAMLFLHGGGLNAHTWDLCCAALSTAFHCIALDQRGHGDSDWSQDADYSIVSQREDVRAFVDHLHLDRFVLVGMSMGAINALAYAVEHAERISALVLIDSGPNPPREGARRIRDFVKKGAVYTSIEAAVEHALSFNSRRDADSLRRSLRQNLRLMPDQTWSRKDDGRRYESLNREANMRDRLRLWEGVSRVACPALVVRGGESDVFLDEDAKKLAAGFPHGRHVTVPGAGHSVQGDNPKALVREIQAFLNDAGLFPNQPGWSDLDQGR